MDWLKPSCEILVESLGKEKEVIKGIIVIFWDQKQKKEASAENDECI